MQQSAFDGWEVTPRFWEFDKAGDRYDAGWLADRDHIVDALVDTAGVTRVRIEVRSGVENPVDYWSQFVSGRIGYEGVKQHFYEKINDNDDPTVENPAGFQWASFDYYVEQFVLPLKAALEKRGRTLTINLCYVDFKWTKLKGSLSHAQAPDEYAELLDLAMQRLSTKYGLNADSVEIILEPDNTDAWNGEAIGKGLMAVRERLARRGAYPRFIAPSTAAASAAPGILKDMERVPGAMEALDVVSYHRYDGGLANGAAKALSREAARAHADLAMLEYVDGDIENLMTDLSLGVTAWQLYGAATAAPTPDEAKPGYLLVRTADGAIRQSPRIAMLSAVFRAIRPGAIRLDVKTTGRGDRLVAYRNTDGGGVMAAYADGQAEFEVAGLAGDVSAIFVSRNDGKMTVAPVETGEGGRLVARTPSAGVLVLTSGTKAP